MWVIVSILSFIFPSFRSAVEGEPILTAIAFLSAAFFVIIFRLPVATKIVFRIPTTNPKIEICFGDFFGESGHKVIPVNEYFDSQLGDQVAPNSIHGQYIQQNFDSDATRFEIQVDLALQGENSKITARPGPRNKSYPIGTTAVVGTGPHKAFLFALTKTDMKTSKASADVPMMLDALDGLWNAIRNHSNGLTVNIPLVGGGQSQVGIDPNHLFRLILISFLIETRRSEVTRTVRIVLHNSVFDQIDLQAIKTDWK